MRAFLASLACVLVTGCGERAPSGSASDSASNLGSMLVRRVVSEPLAEEPALTILARHPDPDVGQPRVGVISPSRDTRVRGADLVSIVLPPPSSVELARSLSEINEISPFGESVTSGR